MTIKQMLAIKPLSDDGVVEQFHGLCELCIIKNYDMDKMLTRLHKTIVSKIIEYSATDNKKFADAVIVERCISQIISYYNRIFSKYMG